MRFDFVNEQERQHHRDAAKHLAQEMRVAEDRVLEVYALELKRLQQVARVRQFLSVLAAKHVKALFNREGP